MNNNASGFTFGTAIASDGWLQHETQYSYARF